MTLTISPQTTAYFVDTLMDWSSDHFAEFPWRSTDNIWHALVAEMMLQRTDADQVVAVYNHFAERFPTPESFLKYPDTDVFASLGLHWRQKNLEALASSLVERPPLRDAEHFLHLPGVGPYINGALRSLHLGKRDYIIDSNVVRIYGRFFGFPTDAETRRKRWFVSIADSMTPDSPEKCRSYNYALIDFTRSLCKPTPSCSQCPLLESCQFARAHGKVLS